MKLINQFFILSIAVLVFLMLFVGCATQKPGETAVKELVRAEMQERVPLSWIDERYLETRNVEISSVEIVEWGNFNKSEKYWPAKIRVVGSAEARTAFQAGYGSSGSRHEFNKIADFRFSKDDYGKWKISTSPLSSQKTLRW